MVGFKTRKDGRVFPTNNTTKSDVNPQIIIEANVLKPGEIRQKFIRDRKSGLTTSQSLKKLTDKVIKEKQVERKKEREKRRIKPPKDIRRIMFRELDKVPPKAFGLKAFGTKTTKPIPLKKKRRKIR